MARKYRYATSRQALYEPAVGATFFEEWTAADTAHHDLLCAELSRLAYAGQGVVTNSLKSIGFALQQWIGAEAGRARMRARGTDGFVATSDDGALTVVAFRGTEANKPEDLIADLITVEVEGPHGGRVHKGFWEAYSAERDQIRAALDRHHRGQLLITGHSLGAALATLAAADHDMTNATLITFGSPRVGDPHFPLRRVASRRFVNCCDVVARIPPESFDTASIGNLLGELTGATTLSSAAALGLSAPLRLATSDARFHHVSEPLYADRTGTLREGLPPAPIQADQQAARASYPGVRLPDASALFAQLTAVLTSGETLARARDALQAFARGLLAGDPVLLRDLADHAPINYVSIFTGRL